MYMWYSGGSRVLEVGVRGKRQMGRVGQMQGEQRKLIVEASNMPAALVMLPELLWDGDVDGG